MDKKPKPLTMEQFDNIAWGTSERGAYYAEVRATVEALEKAREALRFVLSVEGQGMGALSQCVDGARAALGETDDE